MHHLQKHFSTVFALALTALAFNLAYSQGTKEPSVLWKYQTGGTIVSSPVYDGHNIFVGTYDSTFYCLDGNTGKVIWRFRTGGPVGSTAALSDNKLYFFSGDGFLYCVGSSKGNLLWRFKTLAGALPDRRYDWADYYQSSPLLHGGAVCFGAGDGRVYSLDAPDGKLRWSFQTGDVVHTRPAVRDDKLVIGSFDGNLYCLSSTSGNLIWKFKTTGHRYFPRGEVNGNPVIHRDKVLVGARDYNLYALDLEAGYCHWLKTFPFGWALPVTPNDSVLYAGTSDDRMLIALSEETGALLWKTDLGFNNFAALAVHERRGYTGTLNGKVFCVDLTSGEILWTFHTDGYRRFASRYFQKDDRYFVEHIGKLLPNGDAILQMYRELGAVFSSPAIEGRRLYVGSADGTVYCLGL